MTLLLAALACGGSAPEPAADPVRVPVTLALNWFPEPEFGGFYEGVLGGHYAAAGFDVTILPGGPGAPSLELLQSGKAQAAISAADDLLLKRSRGVQAVGVWPAFQLGPQGLMVHAASGIERFDQIEGGNVAIEVGSPFQQHLWKRMAWEGKVKPVPYAGSVGPFVADATVIQQAYITSEPCVARSRGAEVTFLRASEVGWNPYGTLLALPEPVPEWGPAFVAATHTAWEAYLSDPARANAEVSARNDQLPADVLACITEAQRPFVVGTDGLGVMTAARWAEVADTLVALELLPPGHTADGAWKVLR